MAADHVDSVAHARGQRMIQSRWQRSSGCPGIAGGVVDLHSIGAAAICPEPADRVYLAAELSDGHLLSRIVLRSEVHPGCAVEVWGLSVCNLGGRRTGNGVSEGDALRLSGASIRTSSSR